VVATLLKEEQIEVVAKVEAEPSLVISMAHGGLGGLRAYLSIYIKGAPKSIFVRKSYFLNQHHLIQATYNIPANGVRVQCSTKSCICLGEVPMFKRAYVPTPGTLLDGKCLDCNRQATNLLAHLYRQLFCSESES